MVLWLYYENHINTLERRTPQRLFHLKEEDMARMFRPDREGTHRAAFDKNRKLIYQTQTVCGICGKPVDFNLKFPDPGSATVDHIVPVAKGGHPSDIDNLQLAHLRCNRLKSDKLAKVKFVDNAEIGNRVLPQSMDWKKYRGV